MSCDICGRGACTRTFHSIAEQEAFDSEAGANERAMLGTIADLKIDCAAQREAITALRAALDQEREKVANLEAERDLLRRETVALSKDALAMQDAADKAIEAFNFLPRSGLNIDTVRRMSQLARAANVARCPWHKGVTWEPSTLSCPKCQDEEDRRGAAGGIDALLSGRGEGQADG